MDGQPANPYAAPQTLDGGAEAEAAEVANFDSAGLGLRFANLIIDEIIVVILFFVLVFGIKIVSPTTAVEDWTYVLIYGGMFSYYVLCEAIAGRTIGKLITGTRVVRFDGYRPHFPQIIGRTFARFIPFEAFSFLGSSGNGWHDSLSGTRVVRVRR